MANLKEVRTRIASVKSTRQITSAMKMVSASKMRKAQNAIEKLRYYAGHLKDILNEVYKTYPSLQNHQLTLRKEGKKALLLICSSNKGLCGPYNTMILKKAVTFIESLKEQNFEIFLYIIGKKANDFFKKKEFEIINFEQELSEKVSFENAASVADQLKKKFVDDDFTRIDAVYSSFKNVVVQQPVSENIMPLDVFKDVIKPEKQNDFNEEEHLKHILEPAPEDIIDEIIPKVIDIEVFRIFLDSYASEQGARMTAMHKATENASELIRELTLTYNKVRQATITRELVEIVSGAEALK